jgi:hypothetical protein
MSQSVKLLSPAASNPKTAKGHYLPYEAAILHLSPADRSGVMNTCPYASPGCKAACLNTAGHGGIGGDDNPVQRARARKTQWFHEDRKGFMAQLVKEIEALQRKAEKKGLQAVVRLNGTSDIGWTRISCLRQGITYKSLMHAFPRVIFYDYSKVPTRAASIDTPNYFVTFSLSETNDTHAIAALGAGLNVAVVLNLKDSEPMPTMWGGYPVIDGTLHDFRFLDEKGGNIVGLRPKGRAKHDGTGFVRNLDGGFDLARTPVLAAAA